MNAPQSRTIGPVALAIGTRPPFGAIERLGADQLRVEQLATLGRPRRSASRSAKLLFATMDILYGRSRNLPKMRVLELIARVPYQAWENVAYVALTHTASQPNFARRIFDQVRINRFEQDNEQWHLFIIEELIEQQSTRLGFLRHRVVPQVIAFGYYQLSWILYAVRPSWSYRLNADFEDHAEHEYAQLVAEHPEWETTPHTTSFNDDYGHYGSLAELFRQIGYDERLHGQESEARINSSRFG